jgi:pilus assembly protein CpaF
VNDENKRFSIHALIYSVNQGTLSLSTSKSSEYAQVLSDIQTRIAEKYANELALSLYSKGKESQLKSLIMRQINQDQLTATGISSISELTDMIYNDMAGFGVITEYLKDPDVEEININSWQDIYVVYADRKIRLAQAFLSPSECADVIYKMARSGGVILDGSRPMGDSFISKGVRMSGVIPPCVDADLGGAASIRKQKPSLVTRENVVKWGTATEEELDFLTLCVSRGVSLGITGETGSGKTSDLNMILSDCDEAKRIYVIEDTREAHIQGKNRDAVYILTKEAPNPVSMNDGLRLALRFDPDIIVPSEMRGAEAYTAVEAGRTGHTICSTLHANSALTAYDRILTMCLQAGTSLSEERLLKNIVEAFPVMVNKQRLADGSRKYMEIFEATGVENGVVQGSVLFRYEVDHHERDSATGEVLHTVGSHRRVGNISQRLYEHMLAKGADKEQLEPFLNMKGEGSNG